VKPFLLGAAAGYLLFLCCPMKMPSVTRPAGNTMGNAGGFTGGNPGTPRGPGWYGP